MKAGVGPDWLKWKKEISARSEEERIQDVDLLSSESNRLDSSGTKTIPTSQSHFLGEHNDEE